MLSDRIKETKPLEGYLERNEYGTWDWGIYNVPINRGLKVRGKALFRWTGRLKLLNAKRLARNYGFRP